MINVNEKINVYIWVSLFLMCVVCFAACGKKELVEQDIHIYYTANDGEFVENAIASVVEEETRESAVEKGKTILTFMTSSLPGYDTSFSAPVKAFNNANDLYYVEIINNYWGEDLGNQRLRIQAEISTGAGPDLMTYDIFPVNEAIVDNGVVVDLTAFLSQSEITRDKYFGSYAPIVYDEKIYAISTSNMVLTYTIDKDIIGEHNLTLDNMLDALLEYDEAASFLFPYEDGVSIMNFFLSGTKDVWGAVDWNNRSCDFTIETFKKILKVAKKYSENSQKGYEPVMGIQIVNMFDYGRKSLEEEGDILLGAFFDDGNFPVCQSCTEAVMINANTSCLDGAYAFISFLMSKEGQSYTSEPVNKELYSEMIDYYNREYEKNGHEEWIVDDKKKSEIIRMCENAKYFPNITNQILNIIYEEAEAYFSEDKSMEQVIEIIQNRVQLYLME